MIEDTDRYIPAEYLPKDFIFHQEPSKTTVIAILDVVCPQGEHPDGYTRFYRGRVFCFEAVQNISSSRERRHV